MSISIAIGSEPTDLRNIENTIDILTQCLNADKITNLSSDSLENLLDWYNGIYNILTDLSFFSMEKSTS